eukprot:39100-Prymnesium_polylepis.2
MPTSSPRGELLLKRTHHLYPFGSRVRQHHRPCDGIADSTALPGSDRSERGPPLATPTLSAVQLRQRGSRSKGAGIDGGVAP